MGQVLPPHSACSVSQKLWELPARPGSPSLGFQPPVLGFKQHRGSYNLLALAQIKPQDQPEARAQAGNMLPPAKLYGDFSTAQHRSLTAGNWESR